MKSACHQQTRQHPLLCLLIVIALFASGVAQANDETWLVLGDSLSAGYGINVNKGWVALLSSRLQKQGKAIRVINGSVSGNTTGDGLARLPQLLATYTPTLVIIELGGNDGLRGHPLKIMRNNLQQIIDLSRQHGAEVFLVGIEIPPNYGERYTQMFRQTFQQVAASREVSYLPFLLDGIAITPEMMQDDGIHPTTEAQPMILDNLWPHLNPWLQ
ncbi:arylesterase [Halioxenophilus sp. WMMB6]|uniref:arylesterase n=1 Tax=Halioxenophilus sp. WMMB6 TaxID=3073815 RepID=UPI00295E9A1C|nr:arylesterase [Halioxenophilus sp. WMMB6]